MTAKPMTAKKRRKIRRLVDLKERYLPNGSPTVLSKEFIRDFCKTLQECMFIDSACAVMGIPRQTLVHWMCAGRKELAWRNRNPHKAGNPKYHLNCLLLIKSTRAIWSQDREILKGLNRHRRNHWQCAAWLLERRFPEHWSAERAEFKRLQKQVEELMSMLKEREQ